MSAGAMGALVGSAIGGHLDPQTAWMLIAIIGLPLVVFCAFIVAVKLLLRRLP